MPFYTYILQSETSGMLYIGSTNNIEGRIERHNHNRNQFTKNKGPWKLIYSHEFETRSEAIHLEKFLKEMKNKERVVKWINAQLG
jgi:putative endonuclease